MLTAIMRWNFTCFTYRNLNLYILHRNKFHNHFENAKHFETARFVWGPCSLVSRACDWVMPALSAVLIMFSFLCSLLFFHILVARPHQHCGVLLVLICNITHQTLPKIWVIDRWTTRLLVGAEQVRVEWNVATFDVAFQFDDLLQYNSVVVGVRQLSAYCYRFFHIESLQYTCQQDRI